MFRASFSVSTNKPNYWQRFCEALSRNDIDIEVNFVGICDGHEGMTFAVPTKFFRTSVKPAQCWEIGARMATGDVICLAADDCIFTPKAVDDAVKTLSKVKNMFDMVTARYLFEGNDYLFAMRMFSDPQMPLLPVGGFTFSDSYRRMCGIDKRFRAVAWDTDLYMRFCEAGGKTHLLESHSYNETGNVSSLFGRNSNQDLPILHSLWRKDGVLQMVRNDVVKPFDDQCILIKEQSI